MSRKTVPAENPESGGAFKLPVLTDVQVEALGRETGEPGWVVDARRSAWNEYRRMQPPSPADPAWRQSGLLGFPFPDLNLEALAVSGKPKRAPSAWLKPVAGGETGGQLALEDRALHTATLEESVARSGVVFMPLSQAAKEHPDLVRNLLGKTLPPGEGVFSALTSVVYDCGFFLYVPKGVRVEKPLHSLLWSSGEGLRGWRLLVHVDEGAEVSLLHECASPERTDAAARFDLVELTVGRDATLRFFMTQAWGNHIVRVAHEKAVVHRNGRLVWGFAHVGTRMTRTSSALDLREEGASAQWSGLQFLDGVQQAEFSTSQNHQAPKTGSDFLCKGVLSGSARSFSRGMVRVAADAAGADGYQGNRILMLSDKAQAEAIPGLEILSDDVRCSHGVTVGELDPEELFYLRSRGIDAGEARRLLLGGFLEGILARIPEDDIRQRVHLAVDAKMKTMEEGDLRKSTADRKDPAPGDQGV